MHNTGNTAGLRVSTIIEAMKEFEHSAGLDSGVDHNRRNRRLSDFLRSEGLLCP